MIFVGTAITLEHVVQCDEWTKEASLPYDYPHDGVNKTEIALVALDDIQDTAHSIGVIFGPSGCGKTTTARRLFGESADIQREQPDDRKRVWEMLRCGSLDQEEVLNAVDLDPELFREREYRTLSIGEQHRVDIAVTLSRSLCELKHCRLSKEAQSKWFVVDEFTSFLDRRCALKVVDGVNGYIQRKQLQNLLFLSCHSDIVGLIDNAFIVDLLHRRISMESAERRDTHIHRGGHCGNRQGIKWDDRIFDRPTLTITLRPANYKDFDPMFAVHHYKTRDINSGALCFGAFLRFEDSVSGRSRKILVGFTSVITADSFHYDQYQYSGHRTVVLPRYQGLGIGSRISDATGEWLKRQRPKSIVLHSKTAHPWYGRSRNRNPLWKAMGGNGKIQKLCNHNPNRPGADKVDMGPAKLYFSHIYVGLPGDDLNVGDRLQVIQKRT